jgi:hypothetical protein
MMVGACLVPLITLALALAPDAASLVARLGAGTVAEREESAKQLEAMGREVLPALVAALRSPDAEVRSRVLPVWERIQKGLLVRPSMVRLEGQGRPLHEVVRSIGEQGGFSLRASQQGPERLFDAREPVTIPFWEAVDRLGLSGGHFDIANPIGGHFPTLEFGGFKAGYPSAISGPLRITLNGLHDHRDRLLIGGPWLRVDEMNQRIPIPRTAKEREARFYIEFGMMIEPRMWFTQEGPARAIEAVDDLGQSLVRRDATRVKADHSVFHNGGGVTEGRYIQLDLAMPEKPGRSIVRLRGSIPVAIQIRRPVPDLEIPLSAPPGKTFAHEDGVFTLHEVRENDQGTLINLDLRINFDRFDLPAGRDGEIVTSRLRCLESHQVEIVDADGHVLTEHGGGGTTPDGKARMSFMVWKNQNKTRPARFRYYGMVRAFTDVAFEFRNIPMP